MIGRFFPLQNKLISRAELESPEAKELGRFREEKTQKVLEDMKKRGVIIDFVKTAKFSEADIMDGVDFYVVVKDIFKRKSVPLSVTGPLQVFTHKKKHPDIPIIAIGLNTSREEMEKQILQIVSDFK